jgi:hypothetical protein
MRTLNVAANTRGTHYLKNNGALPSLNLLLKRRSVLRGAYEKLWHSTYWHLLYSMLVNIPMKLLSLQISLVSCHTRTLSSSNHAHCLIATSRICPVELLSWTWNPFTYQSRHCVPATPFEAWTLQNWFREALRFAIQYRWLHLRRLRYLLPMPSTLNKTWNLYNILNYAQIMKRVRLCKEGLMTG